MPSYTKIEKTGNNVYEITLNGEQVGTVSDTKDADSLLWQARKEIAKEEDVLFLADAELSVTGREAYFAQFTGEDEIIANLTKEEFMMILTPRQLDIYLCCIVSGVGIREYAKANQMDHSSVRASIACIRKK